MGITCPNPVDGKIGQSVVDTAKLVEKLRRYYYLIVRSQHQKMFWRNGKETPEVSKVSNSEKWPATEV